MLFGLARMNFKILLLKILMLLGFLICRSRLFHSFIVEGKRKFLKKSCFVQSWGMFSEFWEKYLVFNEGISWKRYLRDWLLIILNKQQKFLYQRLCWRNSKPNSWQKVPLTAPVIANTALYWIDSIFWWNEMLYAQS